MGIFENLHVVPVLSDGDLAAGATLSGDSINMKNFHSAAFIVGLQTLGGADSTVAVYSGATNGTCTSALTFRYRFGGAAAGSASSDVFGAWTSGTSVTLTHGTYDNYTLQIEVEASAMDLANNENWLTIQFADPATGGTGNVQVHALLKPRYASNAIPTAI